mmetsp:Transcript_50150/g.57928  ORF Transcript_50150/g.57928 Transcript_50150/m.57928 type:complete len:327 (+) Transcript_50150:33-1013(+)
MNMTSTTTNSLFGVDGTWIGDGSNGTLTTSSSSDISVVSGTRGSPFNVMFDVVAGSTEPMYFEVDVIELSGNIAIGVVCKAELLPGYKTRGMFYNGNVTNGNAGLIINFGDYVKANSKVGVLVQRETSGAVEVIFYMDGVCLGAGFCLPQFGTEEVLSPSFHVTGKAKVSFHVPSELPGTKERSNAGGESGYVGDWKLERFSTGPELHEFPLPVGRDIILTVAKEDEGEEESSTKFWVSIKVANMLRCKVEIVGKMENFDKVSVGGVMSTRMLPSPELQTLEQLVAKSFPTCYKMIVSEDLIMTAPAAEFCASRYSKSFSPAATYS